MHGAKKGGREGYRERVREREGKREQDGKWEKSSLSISPQQRTIQ